MKILIKKASGVFALKVVASLMSLAFYYLLAMYLPVSQFGLFSLAITLSIFIGAMIKQGFEQLSVRYFAQRDSTLGRNDETAHFYWFVIIFITLSTSLIACVIFVFGRWLTITVFNQYALLELLPLVIWLSLVQALLAINSSVFKGVAKPKLSMLFSGCVTFSIAILVLIIERAETANSALVILLFSAVIALLVSFVFTARYLSITTFKGKLLFDNAKTITSSSWQFFIIGFSAVVTQHIAMLVLGMFEATEQLGIYALALKFSLVAGYPLLAINAITTPQFARYHAKGDMIAFGKLANTTSTLFLVLATSVVLVLGGLAYYLIPLIGVEYIASIYIVHILLCGYWVNLATGSVVAMLTMAGYESLFKKITLYLMLINIVLMFVFVPFYGMYAAASVTSLIMALKNIIAWYCVRRLVLNKDARAYPNTSN